MILLLRCIDIAESFRRVSHLFVNSIYITMLLVISGVNFLQGIRLQVTQITVLLIMAIQLCH